MLDIERSLIDIMWASPDDPRPRGVYVDWLTDQDDGRVRYLHADMRLAALSPDDADYSAAWSDLVAARGLVDPDWICRAGWHYEVVLERVGSSKLQLINSIRACTGLGFRRARALMDTIPSVVLGGLDGAWAEAVRQFLEDIRGLPKARVTLRRHPPRANAHVNLTVLYAQQLAVALQPLRKGLPVPLVARAIEQALAVSPQRAKDLLGQNLEPTGMVYDSFELVEDVSVLDAMLVRHRLRCLLPTGIGVLVRRQPAKRIMEG